MGRERREWFLGKFIGSRALGHIYTDTVLLYLLDYYLAQSLLDHSIEK